MALESLISRYNKMLNGEYEYANSNYGFQKPNGGPDDPPKEKQPNKTGGRNHSERSVMGLNKGINPTGFYPNKPKLNTKPIDYVAEYNDKNSNAFLQPLKKTSLSDVEKANQFMVEWFNSPRYNKIVRNKELYPEGYKNMEMDNFRNTRIKMADEKIYKDNSAAAVTLGDTGDIKRLPKLTDNVKQFAENGDIILSDRIYPNTTTHEIVHKLTNLNKNIPKNIKTEIKNRTNQKKHPNSDYLKNPSEVLARVYAVRQYGKDSKLYDPFTEKFEQKHLNELIRRIRNNEEIPKNLEDLLQVVNSDKDFIWMMNNLAKNENKSNDNEMMA